MRVVWPVLACALLFYAAQEDAWVRNPQRVTVFGSEMVHANGLHAAPPEGYVAVQTKSGFAFTELANNRFAREMYVDLLDDEPRRYGTKVQTLSWLAGEAEFVVTQRESDFRHPWTELRAIRRIGDQWIMLTATAPPRTADSDFEIAWAVLDRLEFYPEQPEVVF